MLRLLHVTFSCADPERVATFWAQLLDYEAEGSDSSWTASDPREEGVRLLFNEMPKSETIELPIHLDVNVPDREAELARVLELGGKLVETKSHLIGDLSETWTVMRDPEGNGFCLQSPGNALPHRYIGNVTFSCAEPRELGRFWSSALGWPDEEIDQAFLRQLLDAGMDEQELGAFYVTRPPNNGRPRFLFQRREKSRPDAYPIHLDFATDDREAEIERLTSAGASIVETKRGTNLTFTILRDPEGNPFCVG
jgi:predicted enzyme related to lactoylglutathione lyase